jgi:monovalent cation/hydrogen antiporter
MTATALVLASLFAVVISGFLARASRLPAPLVQIALGALLYQTGLVSVVLEPEVFFLLFLPPLLFLDGWRIPKDSLARDAPAVLSLALGLVVFTVLGMGLFIHWLIPAIPMAVAFALAAVLSPTDPVAVSAIAAGAPLPDRLMRILQGEALLNDATGLVCLRFAVATALTGTFSLSAALATFAWVATGGIVIGAALTWLVAQVTSRLAERFGEAGGSQIVITLLIPFGVYLVAERAGCSGILAAVAAGFTMSYMDIWQWRASTRLRRTAVWDTVQLVANGSVFVLLGEQLPRLIAAVPASVSGTALEAAMRIGGWICIIVAGLTALRWAWVWVSLWLARVLGRTRRPKTPQIGAAAGGAVAPVEWRLVLAMSVAGVRGAVTLAGVFTLPLVLGDGTPFPARDLTILIAAGVIVLSLVLAALALPLVLKGFALADDASDRAAEVEVRIAATKAAIAAVETARLGIARRGPATDRVADIATRILALYRHRLTRGAEAGGETDTAMNDAIERELRVAGLRAEREEIRRAGRLHAIDDLAVRRMVRELDLQEARFLG